METLMAKKKQAVARTKTASKRGKARTRGKSVARMTAKRGAVKTKAKKQATKARAKRAAPKKAAPRTEPPRQLAQAFDETVIFDIIEEPVPGVVVVTEFETVRTSKPETPTQQPEGGEGSSTLRNYTSNKGRDAS
jgi:membrane protein involved in colicin uptake